MPAFADNTPRITRYYLRYIAQAAGAQNETETYPVLAAGVTLSETVTNLRPNTEYHFFLTPSNEPIGGLTSPYYTGNGPESDVAPAMTMKSAPGRVYLRSNHVDDLSNVSLVVHLAPPDGPGAESYGLQIVSYTVDFCKRSANGCDSSFDHHSWCEYVAYVGAADGFAASGASNGLTVAPLT